MFNYPRRPVYNYRSEDMPQEVSSREVNTIDSRRFWQLFRNLRRRQEDARNQREEDKKAKTG